jgi:glutaminyl-peptide cyclotransferase
MTTLWKGAGVSRICAMAALTFALLPWLGCMQGEPASADVQAKSASRSAAAAAMHPQASSMAAEPGLASRGSFEHINGAHAMRYVKEVVAFGPRPIGSPAHARLEDYLRAHLKADSLEEDSFTTPTPVGDMHMRNFIAKFSGKRDGIIVIAGHYDTLYGRKDFVGANDGGSSTGLPLAIADSLRAQKQRAGYSVWIVLLDGEEAVKQWSSTDSVYGARHLAAKWKRDGTAAKVKAFLLLDMVGDAELNIERDQNSTPWLEDLVYRAALGVGYQSHFFARTVGMEDDHLPFREAGIAVSDLIDFDYGYNNVLWHSPEDKVDKLSAQSLVIAGDTVLESVRLLDQRP